MSQRQAHTPRPDRRHRQLTRDPRHVRSRHPLLESLETRLLLATSFVEVTTASDNGDDAHPVPGSLREAIDFLLHPGQVTEISFDIGSGVQTITPLSALPTIVSPIVIDGSAPADHPDQVIVINGGQVKDADGLIIAGGSSTVENLTIDGFTSNPSSHIEVAGIRLEGVGGDLVQGCQLGTNALGAAAVPNDTGIIIYGVPNNTIGGTTSAARNIVSGNNRNGVGIYDSESAGNIIEGNFIGTDLSGARRLANGTDGVLVSSARESSDHAASNNTIGGPTLAAGNVVSGNGFDGIQLFHASANTVASNLIGTDVSGHQQLGNVHHGIDIVEAANNTIGGAGAGNVVSGNGFDGSDDAGIAIEGGGSSGNVLQDNEIGTDVSGTAEITNALDGVLIGINPFLTSSGAPSHNTIGATSFALGNVISGNAGDGIKIVQGTDNLVEGNLIGIVLTPTGSTPLGNARGVEILSGTGNTIGGVTTAPGTAPGNVISGNIVAGIRLGAASGEGGASGNLIVGNIIGLDVGGTMRDPDGVPGSGDEFGNQVGVLLDNAPANTIGGLGGASTRNLISGNIDNGIYVLGTGSTADLVAGNYIGTDIKGTLLNAGNGGDGVKIEHAPGNIIGGIQPLFGTGGNVISGNDANGVEITGADATGNQIIGNYIGTDASGRGELFNGRDGILLAAPKNTIGSSVHNGQGNIISGNLSDGIQLVGADANHNTFDDNFIGTDFLGQHALGNHGDGVELDNAPDNTIGDPRTSNGNVISGNGQNGLELKSPGTTRNLIVSNAIGTSPSGFARLQNSGNGILITDASGNTIGGIQVGIEPLGNIIGGNGLEGISIRGSSTSNRILGNFIGTNVNNNSLDDVGNKVGGIYIAASSNTIGGTESGAGNVIAHNGQTGGTRAFGVSVGSGTGNSIRGNSIYANAGRGIDLGDDPKLNLNDLGDADAGPNNMQNYPYITAVHEALGFTITSWTLNSTPSNGFDIDFYSNRVLTASGFGDGATYLSSKHVTTDANGMAAFVSVVPSNVTYIAATATDSAGNTSEFSMVDSDADGLADSWEKNGIDFNGDGTIDYTLPGADPMHKDVFVEVDAMQGHAPLPLDPSQEPAMPKALQTGTYLDQVVATFANAPQALVHNPDGTGGINLHIQPDELGINDFGFIQGNDGWTDFYGLKSGTLVAGGFGTPAERANPTVLAAKSLAYRYSVFADYFLAADGTDDYSGSSESIVNNAHVAGNDFFVTLGHWPDQAKLKQLGYPMTVGDFQAGTFMHELGHTLGLGHGGGDDVNFKPNYHSVMNYLWQMPYPWMYESWLGKDENGDGTATATEWNLDYSEQALPPLNETGLVESDGIDGNPNVWLPYPIPPDSLLFVPKDIPLVHEAGGVDWNKANGITPLPIEVQADINNDGHITTLAGFEDWSHLQYGFVDSYFYQGQVGGDHSISYTEWQQVAGVVPGSSGPGTLQLSAASYDVHESAGSITIGVVRTGASTGAVSVHFTTSAGTATSGADYTETSGDLNFADGQLSASITIPILDDTLAEGDETFTITLSNPTGGAALGAPGAAMITIDDDEQTHPTTFTVTNVADSGPGSLRQAILDANGHLGTDTIAFDISGGTIILPESPLPTITDPMTIDATTQPGYAGTPLLQITGLLAGDDATGLKIMAGQTTVKGLIIDGFNVGLELDGASDTISGNWIGPESTETVDLGNRTSGIVITAGASGNLIGGAGALDGNLVSGNAGTGIVVAGSGNRLWGNFVGTDATGLAALGNTTGIVITGSNNSIGGPSAGQGNLISGNSGDGLDIVGSTATGNTIQGNVIGLHEAQGHTVGNGGDAVMLGGGSSQNLIGGASAGAGNTINNDAGIAVHLEGGAVVNQLEGNTITAVADPHGDDVGGPAIQIEDASNNMIGGVAPGAGNLVRSDFPSVVVLSGTGNSVRGNALFSTLGLGIDLGFDSRTDNDSGDADTGPNLLQNFPVVDSAKLSGTSVVIDGDLDSTPGTKFAIDLYTNVDGSATGEDFFATINVTTDATGHAHWTLSVPGTALTGFWLAATATDLGNNTSEFSDAFELDVDGDGVSDHDESLAANNGDANFDGVPDRFEANVASERNLVSFVAPAGTQFIAVSSASSPSFAIVPGRPQFPVGLFTWQLQGLAPGAAVDVKLLVGDAFFVNAYYRFGPTPDQPLGHWDTYGYDGTTGAVINGQTITLHLVDGGRGDDDLAPNGVIRELGAPADGPKTFVVTNSNDAGPGSLRQAILDSNAHPATDTIAFAIGSGPQTISLLHVLPDITNPAIIDATTQPGYAGTPLISLVAASNNQDVIASISAETSFDWAGLTIRGGSSTVRGLAIEGFGSRNFPIAGSTFFYPAEGAGILVIGQGANLIQSNTLSGNTYGVEIGNGTINGQGENVIAGNVIVNNARVGVFIRNNSSGNRIGGTDPRDRNLISGNGLYGVQIGSLDSNTVVEGNLIGVAADGVTPEGNGQAGVDLNVFSTTGGITIGGTAAGAGNVIAYNGSASLVTHAGFGAGVKLEGAVNSPQGDPILGNSIFQNTGLGISYPTYTYNSDVALGDAGYQVGGTLGSVVGQSFELPNYPILGAASHVGNNTVIDGRIDGQPLETYRVELFSNSDFDPSGFGEGQTYLGAINVTTDGKGSAHFTATLPTIDPAQRFVTATATASDGATSPYSARLAIGDALGSVFVVNTADDHDDGVADATDTSLREAIIAANNHPGVDTIEFQIGSGVQTISPKFDLPAITDPVIIDGTTQPGYQGTPLIVLKGTYNPSHQSDFQGPAIYGLRLVAVGTTVRGLAINGFSVGIADQGFGSAGDVIQGCFFGTNVTGTSGTVTGQAILLAGSNNLIGGTTPGARNVISGNRGPGITILGTHNLIEGNLIGTDVTGTRPLANESGISIEGNDNTIGGTATGARNIISANTTDGVDVFGLRNLLQGNFIGTDITGTQALGNGGFGAQLFGIATPTNGGGNTVGGTSPGAGNLISGNREAGLWFPESIVEGNTPLPVEVQGNLIGTDVTGTMPLGNFGDGIIVSTIDDTPSRIDPIRITIGGTAAGAGNTIAFNGGRGVNIRSGDHITVLGNAIFSNGGLGIDLGNDGVTLNDPGDVDTGSNQRQNFPVISQALAGPTTRVIAALDSQPNITYLVSFYASAVADPSGHGEGQRYLGSTMVQTDATGHANVVVELPASTAAGEVLTATATDPDGNTSEFSQAASLNVSKTQVAPVLTLSSNPGSTTTYGQAVGFTTTVAPPDGGGPTPTGTVQFQIDGANFGPALILDTNGTATSTLISSLSATAHTISALYSGDSTYTAATANVAINVLPAAPTVNITAPNATYDAAPYDELTSSVTGVGNANLGTATSFTFFVGAGTGGADLGTTAPTATGTYTVVAHYGGSANYAAVDSAPATFTIDPRPITITTSARSKVYGAADPALTYQITSGSLENGDSVSGTLTRAAGEHVSSYAIQQGTLTAGINYAITFVAGTLTITPAPLTIAANDVTRVYGQPNPPLTVSYATFVNGDTVSSLQTPPTVTTTATTFSSVSGSPYPINVGGAVDPDYTITYLAGKLTIKQDGTATTVTAAGSVFGQRITLSASVIANAPGSGTISGSVDFFDVTTGNDLGTVPLSSGKASLATAALAPGMHTIRASYSGDGNFLASGASTSAIGFGQSILILDPKASGALSLSGNASVQVSGDVIVDSSSPSALSASGNASLTAGAILVHGGTQKSGKATLQPMPKTDAPSMADPFTALPAPSTAGLTNYGAVSLAGRSRATIKPGIYSRINVSGNAVLTMTTGTYIIEGGGFTISGDAAVNGSGVFVYNAGSNYPGACRTFSGITVSGNGTCTLSAGDSGPYAGIVIFQARQNTCAVAFSGNAMGDIAGVIYIPSARLSMSGNARFPVSFIADTASLSGNVNFNQSARSCGAIASPAVAHRSVANDRLARAVANELPSITLAASVWDAALASQTRICLRVAAKAAARTESAAGRSRPAVLRAKFVDVVLNDIGALR